jgi:hypothetical protein
LLYYIQHLFTQEWFETESPKTELGRHPLLVWFDALSQHQKKNENSHAKIQSAPMTGAAAVYLALSYSLYLIAHNVRLQERLRKRLPDAEHFMVPTMKPMLLLLSSKLVSR